MFSLAKHFLDIPITESIDFSTGKFKKEVSDLLSLLEKEINTPIEEDPQQIAYREALGSLLNIKEPSDDTTSTSLSE